MKIKLVSVLAFLNLFGCASKPTTVSFYVKNVNGSTLTCLNSEIPESLDLDRMALSDDQKEKCFLEQCRNENNQKVCTKIGNSSVLSSVKGEPK